MPSLFYAGQPDYIEKLNTLATAASMTNGTVAASFLSLAVTGTATAASFVGPLTGNASTATTLATARNINGVSFNGSADITVTAAAGTLTGATLAAGVTASSLTSVGTLTALTVSGQASFAAGSAAAPSVKVGAEQNGLYRSEANTLSVALGGLESFRFGYVASAVNYGQFASNSAGGYPSLRAAGSDTNIGFDFSTQGAAPFRFYTSAFGAEQLRILSTSSAVNYVAITGSATGNAVTVSAAGSDTNVALGLYSKNAGTVFAVVQNALALTIANQASAVNSLVITGAATGNSVQIATTGSDSNRSISINATGTGRVAIGTGAGGVVAGFGTYDSAEKAIYILNTTNAPTANPATGGYLYCEGGALKYRGSSGTVSTIAAA